MKKLITTLFAATLTIFTMVTPVLAKDITLTFNGKTLNPTVAPIMVNGTTFIPLRIVADNLGAQTNYTKTAKNEYIEIVKSGTTIKLAVNAENGYPQVDGKAIDFKTLPKVVNSTTMVPVRFVSENLGCTVGYDSKTNTVSVSTDGQVANTSGITVKVDGKVVKLDEPAFVEKGLVYIPATVVKEIGAEITNKQGFGIKRKDFTINLVTGSKYFNFNGARQIYNNQLKRTKSMDFITDEVFRYMNCDTNYDSTTKTLEITNKGPIKVELSKERYVDLTGRVLYMDGTPAKNIKVDFVPVTADGSDGGESYYSRRGLKAIEPVYTDENGFFIFKNLDTETIPFGIVTIGIDPSGRTPKGEWRGQSGTEVNPELLNNVKPSAMPSNRLNLKRGDLGTIYLYKK